ncbi:MAG: hypothetical protein AAGE52_24905 [Myxococcota bacterium]
MDANVCDSAIASVEVAMRDDGATRLPLSDPSVELPTRPSGTVEAARSGYAITVGRTSLLFDGSRTDEANLRTNLATIGRNRSILYPEEGEWDRRINVVVDARVAFSRLDAVLQPLVEEGYAFVLLAEMPTAPVPPCPSSWAACDELGDSHGAERATQVAAMLSSVLGTRCSDVRTVFARLAGVRFEDQSDVLRRELPEALQACECQGVSMERLEWLVPELVNLRVPRAVGVAYEPNQSGLVGPWIESR